MDILSMTLEELTSEMELLKQPKYRAKQIFEWLHAKKATDFAEITVLPAQLRTVLEQNFCIKSLNIQKTLVSKRKDTVKYLYGLEADSDSNSSTIETIETVFMRHEKRDGNSICISSQVGCKMGCKFCASGKAGFERNLTPSEMLSQIYQTLKMNGLQTASIVIMGVGEPLDNYDNVVKFLQLLRHSISLRHVSLSTCGLADKIDELAQLKLGLTLSVSLHAVTDEERTAIMPINKTFGLERLLSSCNGYWKTTGRRISFEYALIDGVNDSVEHASSLAVLLSRKLPKAAFHVNLIPVNEIKETSSGVGAFKKSGNSGMFAGVLEKSGITVTVRRTMGGDINAACGQLRIKQIKEQIS